MQLNSLQKLTNQVQDENTPNCVYINTNHITNSHLSMTDNYQSYEQIYSDNNQPQQQQQQDSSYQNQLMLDQNDQIELYQSHNHHHQQNHLQFGNDNTYIQQHNSCDSIIHELNQVDRYEQNNHQHQPQQCYQHLYEKEVIDYLKTNYPHFNQQILIKMLYDSLFPAQNKIDINTKKQLLQTFSTIKRENLNIQTNQQKDINSSLTKLHQTAKIFVEHGYGINIARKYALKGQNIESNPYNNAIGKLIKNAWKDIETQMINIKKSIKQLRTEKYNQIKTPLIHSRNWMQKKYIDIFNQIILYVHGISSEKPSQKSYQQIYNYVMQNAIRKSKSSEKGFYKKKNQDSDFNQNSSQQFKPQKLQKLTDQRFEHLTNIVKKSFKKSTK